MNFTELPTEYKEDPYLNHLRTVESLSEPLPTGGTWDESVAMKNHVDALLYVGHSDLDNGGSIHLREIVDGLDYNGFICSLGFSGYDEWECDVYGRGKCVADSVLAALVQLEVELMLKDSE